MRHFTLVTILFVAATPTHAGPPSRSQPRVEMEDLGSVGTGGYTIATAINNRGQVVGYGHENDDYGNVIAMGFIWSPRTGFIPLGPASPADINDRGHVVGTYRWCDYFGDCWQGGFMWSEADGWTSLESFYPSAINNAGAVAGICGSGEPCVMVDGVVRPLASDSFCCDSPSAINNRGDVLWGSLVWRHGVSTEVDEGAVYLSDMNDRGAIAGRRWVAEDSWRATIWDRKRRVTLTLDRNSYASAINNRGVAVGGIGSHAMAWNPKRWVTDLGTLGGDFSVATDINDRGQNVGFATTASGEMHARRHPDSADTSCFVSCSVSSACSSACSLCSSLLTGPSMAR